MQATSPLTARHSPAGASPCRAVTACRTRASRAPGKRGQGDRRGAGARRRGICLPTGGTASAGALPAARGPGQAARPRRRLAGAAAPERPAGPTALRATTRRAIGAGECGVAAAGQEPLADARRIGMGEVALGARGHPPCCTRLPRKGGHGRCATRRQDEWPKVMRRSTRGDGAGPEPAAARRPAGRLFASDSERRACTMASQRWTSSTGVQQGRAWALPRVGASVERPIQHQHRSAQILRHFNARGWFLRRRVLEVTHDARIMQHLTGCKVVARNLARCSHGSEAPSLPRGFLTDSSLLTWVPQPMLPATGCRAGA
eukprot:356460-Chlamydomonas_euryale.AAC.5